MLENINSASSDDLEAVVATVQRYVDGMKSGRSSDLSGSFLDDAVVYGAINDALVGGPIESFYAFVDQSGSAPQMNASIRILDITPSSAVVRVDIEKDATGTDYTDYHTLIKKNEQWNIIAKVFHMNAR